MECDRRCLSWAMVVVTFLGVVMATPAYSATVSFEYTESFGDVPPDGPPPFATAVFADVFNEEGSVTSVQLTMTVAETVGLATVKAMYFNLDPSMDPTALVFAREGGSGPTEADTDITTGADAFRPGGDGFYDILFEFPPPPGQTARRFNAGEDLIYAITGSDLTAGSFNFFATPGPSADNPGPYLSVARFQSTGPEQDGGDWVGAVPVPPAVWLLASGLVGFAAVARRTEPA